MPKTEKLLGGVDRPYDREYGQNQSLLPLWDCSGRPSKNDRLLKLGQSIAQRGVAIFSFDRKNRATQIVDGLHGSDVNTIAQFEPDNWVPRLHTPGGRGPDNVWALRLVVEHDNKSDKLEHRSTIWVDQCEQQHWAWSMDALWVVNLQASVADQEIQFNGAGFLDQLYGASAGGRRSSGFRGTSRQGVSNAADPNAPIVPIRPPTPTQGGSGGPGQTQAAGTGATRGALAINISKVGGFLSDGELIGQIWHILSIPEPEKATPKPKDGTCAPYKKSEAAIRGDVAFHLDADLASLSFCDESQTAGSEYDEGDLIFGQHIVLDDVNELPPDRENQDDLDSNQPELPRRDRKGIWVCIRVPSVDYYGYEVPPKRQGG